MHRIGDVLQPLLSKIDEIGGYRSPSADPYTRIAAALL
jgi:hypothetical protein